MYIPCLAPLKSLEEVKKEMKSENLVFVHICDDRNVEGQWREDISKISGEHFRLSKEQYKYLRTKFDVQSIPFYALINKNGEVVKSKLKYNSNPQLKSLLKNELEK